MVVDCMFLLSKGHLKHSSDEEAAAGCGRATSLKGSCNIVRHVHHPWQGGQDSASIGT